MTQFGNRLVASVFALFLLGVVSGQCGISEKKAVRAIETLLANPKSNAGRDAGLVVLKFAGASNHQVLVSVGYLPWAGNRDLPTGGQVLMAAFVAGNIQKQIRDGTVEPRPYAGVLAAMQVYMKLKSDDSEFQIPQMENFISMEKRGVLRKHIASVKP